MSNLYNKNYKALIIRKKNNKCYFKIDQIKKRDLIKDEVLVQVKYSTLNYKDILVCNGNPGLVRKYPHVPGIDASGVVVESKSKKFKKNDKVMVVAQPSGIHNNGGFSEFLYINYSNLEKIPKNFSLKQSMIVGTAGFTAALSIMKLMSKNQFKKNQLILVTGATGGVGLISILLLKILGFKVEAITSNYKKKSKFLRDIGANNVLSLKEFNSSNQMPLNKMKYDGIIDTIGGKVIGSASKQLKLNSSIMLIGNISNSNFELNIMPFIIRGVRVRGINAEGCSKKERKETWKLLNKVINNENLTKIYKECKFNEVINEIKNFKNKNRIGRIIVKIN